jgi:hypothetical protein
MAAWPDLAITFVKKIKVLISKNRTPDCPVRSKFRATHKSAVSSSHWPYSAIAAVKPADSFWRR